MISTEKKLRESEERFKALFKSSPVPTYAWQKVGGSFELIDFNNAAEEITQGGVINFLGSKASDMYKDHPYILEKLNRCVNEKINITDEIKYKMQSSKDVKDLIVKYVFVPPDLVLVHTEDITERKKTEEKYRILFNNTPFSIVLFNIDGTILDCNDATEKITGYNKEELIGNNFRKFNFYVDLKSANIEERQIQTSSGKIPKPREVLLYKKDGSQFWSSSQIEFIHLGESTYIQAFIHDITEKKQSEIKINESEQRLQERVKELNCLFEISKVAENQNLSLNEIIMETVNLIPYAWQFPKLTSTRIIYDGNEFESVNFKESKWTISGQVDINTKPMDIKIFYQEDKPFLQEEENLLVEISNRLKTIIEKKNSEVNLNTEKHFTEDILNSSTDTIFVFNPETGEAIRWNSGFNEATGYSDEEISSMKAPDSYYSDQDLNRASEAIERILNDEIATVELSLITKDSRKIPYEYRATAFKNNEGKLFIVSIGRDITERKEAEQKLKESEMRYREAYDKANFYKDLFTHDMNNILQIVNSSAELIGFQLGDSESSMFIENMTKMIKSQVDRGSKLISDVRTLTELDEEEEISTKQVNISKFLNSAINFVKKAYSDRNISIFAEKLDQKYYTNANELLQDVFDNILINSVKYNENLGVEIYIKISKQIMDGKNYFKLELSDNGIGVPDDRKDVIFQPGNRELKGTKGMGIGLSLVKKILEIFEGKIWVEDKIKGDYTKGSNFIVLLPEVN